MLISCLGACLAVLQLACDALTALPVARCDFSVRAVVSKHCLGSENCPEWGTHDLTDKGEDGDPLKVAIIVGLSFSQK